MVGGGPEARPTHQLVVLLRASSEFIPGIQSFMSFFLVRKVFGYRGWGREQRKAQGRKERVEEGS